MAFARRKLPIVVGVEAVGTVKCVGRDVSGFAPGDRVVMYAGQFCGRCARCKSGQENLCSETASIAGFHTDGFATERFNIDQSRLIKVPDAVPSVHAVCATTTFGTVHHMLVDNAQLRAGETVLVHAGGSGVGSSAIVLAKALGATVYATVGTRDKIAKVEAIGADVVIDYETERFEGVIRRLTNRRGVDVVFEHVGPKTWQASLACLARGGRLVTCGSTTGVAAPTNLYQVFQQQLHILGSFGCKKSNVSAVLELMRSGAIKPVIDSVIGLGEFHDGLQRLADRAVVGKIVLEVDARTLGRSSSKLEGSFDLQGAM
jgi:alcohol dehydrogenase